MVRESGAIVIMSFSPWAGKCVLRLSGCTASSDYKGTKIRNSLALRVGREHSIPVDYIKGSDQNSVYYAA